MVSQSSILLIKTNEKSRNFCHCLHREHWSRGHLYSGLLNIPVTVIGTPILPSQIKTGSTNLTSEYVGFDLDQDGTNDFEFASRITVESSQGPLGSLNSEIFSYPVDNFQSTNSWIAEPQANSGNFIDINAYNLTNTVLFVSSYVGLKVVKANGTNYGWASFQVSIFSDRTVNLTGYAYETKPNQPLMLGETAEPPLTIDTSESGVVLSWPTNYASLILKSTTNCVSAIWKPVLTVPVIINGLEVVSNSISGPQMFYGLGR